VKTALVVNPTAGSGRAGRLWPRIAEFIGPSDCAVSAAAGDVELFARERLQAGFNLIVVVGGDGTIHEAVNAFFENGRPVAPQAVLAPVPIGTACDLARMLVLPTRQAAYAQHFTERKIRLYDVGLITLPGSIRCFLNVASAGLGAEAARRRRAALGRPGYLAAALVSVARMEPPLLQIDDASPVPLLHVAIGNGRCTGGGINVCPLASPEDGLLDITLIAPVSTLEVARSVRLLYNGRIHSHPAVRHMRVRSLLVRGPAMVEADGEICGPLPATFSVLPRALRVLA
jgi:diacylglycerol kinase (ATP)